MPRGSGSRYNVTMNDASLARVRWLYLTLGFCVNGLLLVEFLLWLSEESQWFQFHGHKDWTALIAAAAGCLLVLLLLLWGTVALAIRLRFKFSVRSLLLAVVIVAGFCSMVALTIHWANRHLTAVAAIKRLGGKVEFCSKDGANRVDFRHAQFSDADLELVKGVSRLEEIWLSGTQVTDAGLERIKGLTDLRCLHLDGTQITDAGLQHLEGLSQTRIAWSVEYQGYRRWAQTSQRANPALVVGARRHPGHRCWSGASPGPERTPTLEP